jgi:hypothetical protein
MNNIDIQYVRESQLENANIELFQYGGFSSVDYTVEYLFEHNRPIKQTNNACVNFHPSQSKA